MTENDDHAVVPTPVVIVDKFQKYYYLLCCTFVIFIAVDYAVRINYAIHRHWAVLAGVVAPSAVGVSRRVSLRPNRGSRYVLLRTPHAYLYTYKKPKLNEKTLYERSCVTIGSQRTVSVSFGCKRAPNIPKHPCITHRWCRFGRLRPFDAQDFPSLHIYLFFFSFLFFKWRFPNTISLHRYIIEQRFSTFVYMYRLSKTLTQFFNAKNFSCNVKNSDSFIATTH